MSLMEERPHSWTARAEATVATLQRHTVWQVWMVWAVAVDEAELCGNGHLGLLDYLRRTGILQFKWASMHNTRTMKPKQLHRIQLSSTQNIKNINMSWGEYVMHFTHLVKLPVTVDFILVNKRQHYPVTDDGALEGWKWKEIPVCGLSIAATSKCQDKKGILTIPTEVMAVTVLMMVGMGLNLPAWKRNGMQCNDSSDGGVSKYI